MRFCNTVLPLPQNLSSVLVFASRLSFRLSPFLPFSVGGLVCDRGTLYLFPFLHSLLFTFFFRLFPQVLDALNAPDQKAAQESSEFSESSSQKLTPIRKNNVTAKEEVPSNLGLENFVINLRTRLADDTEEATKEWSERSAYLNSTVNRLDTKLQNQEHHVALLNEEMEGLTNQMDEAKKAINHTKALVTEKVAEVDEMEVALHTADKKWNQTIDLTVRQRNAAKSSLVLLDKMKESLNGPNPEESISSIVKESREKLADKKMESLMELAIKASSDVSTDQIGHFRDVLAHLKKQMMIHLEDLEESLLQSRDGRDAHIRKMKAQLWGLHDEAAKLRDQILDHEEAIPEILTQREKFKDPIAKMETGIQELSSELKEWERLEKYETARELAHTNFRVAQSHLVENIRQTVKELVVNQNPQVVARVLSITDLFKAPGTNETLGDDLTRPRATRPLNPTDLAASAIGSWNFEEQDDSVYVIDDSGNGFDGKIHGADLTRLKPGHDDKGTALVFDGMDDYVDVGTLGNLGSKLNDFTISFWVRTIDTNPALSSILKYVDNGESGVLAIEVNRRVGRRNSDGTWPNGEQGSADLAYQPACLLVYLRGNDGRVLAGHIEQPSLFNNQWHHIQWTVEDASANRMSLFIDGDNFAFNATVEEGPASFTNLKTNLYIGAGNNRGYSEGFFDGALDDIQIFAEAQGPIFGKNCCRVCYETVACGNSCIKSDKKCSEPTGCACNAVSMTPSKDNSTSSSPSSFFF